MNMLEPMNNMLGVERQAPRHFSFSVPYWSATRDGRLMIQYCRKSGQFQFYPRPVSLFTGTRDLEWREVSGRGELFTYTVARMAYPPFTGHTPYLIAVVTLEEKVNLIGNLVNCPLDDVRIGMSVRKTWAPFPDGTNLLMFEPDI